MLGDGELARRFQVTVVFIMLFRMQAARDGEAVNPVGFLPEPNHFSPALQAQ